MLDGFRTNVLKVGGTIVSTAVCIVLPNEAEIVTVAELDGTADVIVNEALVLPAGTVTLSGTAARDGLLLARPIEAPPTSAGALSVTIP